MTGELCSNSTPSRDRRVRLSRLPEIEFQSRFPDAAACVEYLFAARWPQGFICPGCGQAKSWQLQAKT
jgi:hypothetical protein